MMMKARFASAAGPFVAASSRHGDKNRLVEPRRRLKLPGNVEAIENRHAEVQKDHVGKKLLGDENGLFPIMCFASFESAARQQERKHFCRPFIVVDNEDAAR